jgi:hypothetical protein
MEVDLLPSQHPKKSSFVFALLLAAFLCGCENRSQEDEQPVPELTFRTNSALLGDRFVDRGLKFSFQPPKGCAPMPKASLDKARDKIVREFSLDGSFTVEPRNIFINQKEKLICLVSALPKLPLSQEHLKIYQRAVARQAKGVEVKQGLYRHGGLEIRQILIMNADKINFKLIVLQSNLNSFQIDYSLPRPSYEKNLEAIESSIGSVKTL